MSQSFPLLPAPALPSFPDRDAGGRFVAGHPGSLSEAAKVTRLRHEVSKVLVADFLRHHLQFLGGLRAKHPREYLEIMLRLMNEADLSAAEGLPAPLPLDVAALVAQSQAKKDAETAWWDDIERDFARGFEDEEDEAED
jgi:hypothetical protein